MIQYILVAGICLTLAWTTYQDFTNRSIRADTLIIFMVFVLSYNWATYGSVVFFDQALSLAFLSMVGSIALIYVRYRMGSFLNWHKAIGLGDIFFIMIAALGFCFSQFLLWFNLSLILSLFLHFLLRRKAFYGSSRLIPLAGLQAITLVPFYGFERLCNY
ncbi:MAG: hypothetical protein RIC80_05535 [Cyclobacteriaceae bacterium]